MRSICKSFFMVLLLLLLPGCRAAEPVERTQITLMHGWGGSTPDHVAMRRIYEDFQLENPDIELNFDTSPDITMVLEKADDLLALNRMPDIVSTNGFRSFLANAVSRGKALDLSPYLNEDPVFASDVGAFIRDTWQEDSGKIYTLPDVLEVCGYWYNESIFQAAGVTEDGTVRSAVKLPETFDEFFEACDKIDKWSQERGNGIAAIAQDQDQARVLLGAYIAASSREGTAYMQGKTAVCPPADLKKGLDAIDKAYSYYTGFPPTVNDARQNFLSGKSAIYLNGVWVSVEIPEAASPHSLKYAAFPGGYGQKITYVSSSSGYVVGNSGSDKKNEACVRFLKYMLSEPVQKRITSETVQVPSNPKVSAAWISEKQPVLGNALAVCYSAPQKILTLNTILNERNAGALETYLSLSSPTEQAKEGLVSILCQEQNMTGR